MNTVNECFTIERSVSFVKQALKNFDQNAQEVVDSGPAGACYLAGVFNNYFCYAVEKSMPNSGYRAACACGVLFTALAQFVAAAAYGDSRYPPENSRKFMVRSVLNLSLNALAMTISLPSLKLLSFVPFFLSPDGQKENKSLFSNRIV